jgi:hypothetical protein
MPRTSVAAVEVASTAPFLTPEVAVSIVTDPGCPLLLSRIAANLFGVQKDRQS